ncbi:MAG TPA: ABC transporter ATP-binding protein [Candidatus Egerieimonas intestinavium]|uniref:ABC transporter ATP-binding protein n=1 Tax=Candidatus Egerieimonas intestinavium TaxID=2840777 RepID=A0A9D1EK50_9FIRM|nr:ABC transporter ATP-binding protein [Candidatus Egerieimonas intestinavium]
MSDKILLTAEHITKEFPASQGRTLTACNDINLNLYQGKTLGIVGESGSGKSTFVKMIVNILKPTQGRILYEGQDITKLKGEKLRQLRPKIQMVFQDTGTAFHPKMKVVDIVTEPLLNFGRIRRSEKAEKARELLRMVELPESYADRYPHSMSGGQRQRVGIARALALEPEIIVCDEATSALDVSVQDRIIELLVRLQREKGISFIFICHDVALVQSLAHQVAVMYLGNVVEVLPGNEVRTNAQHPYTKALLGAIFSTRMDFTKEIKSIESEAPSPLDVPEGCPFQNRCGQCMEICRQQRPQLMKIAEGHQVACHLFHGSGEICL